MPLLDLIVSTPQIQDEQSEPEVPDPSITVKNPSFASFLLEYLWTPGTRDNEVSVPAFLADERDNGYSITAPMWGEEPSEETRDWGVWAFHGVLIYDGYED